MEKVLETIEQIRVQAHSEIELVKSIEALDDFRVKFLARKGLIAEVFDTLKIISSEERPAVGKLLNELRNSVQSLFENRKSALEKRKQSVRVAVDLTLPGRPQWIGSQHPITQTLDEIKRIFVGMGFGIATGPDIEDDYHNFEALNFPP
ncbi:MAG TPA: phenylalanine--tRNA ligase subunit alpha, partial [Bacteroidota bacterium]|nr:phenylalanine--tRNA ligase subunit alpha [Bacteroidota bacterium]